MTNVHWQQNPSHHRGNSDLPREEMLSSTAQGQVPPQTSRGATVQCPSHLLHSGITPAARHGVCGGERAHCSVGWWYQTEITGKILFTSQNQVATVHAEGHDFLCLFVVSIGRETAMDEATKRLRRGWLSASIQFQFSVCDLNTSLYSYTHAHNMQYEWTWNQHH